MLRNTRIVAPLSEGHTPLLLDKGESLTDSDEGWGCVLFSGRSISRWLAPGKNPEISHWIRREISGFSNRCQCVTSVTDTMWGIVEPPE